MCVRMGPARVEISVYSPSLTIIFVPFGLSPRGQKCSFKAN